MDKKQIQVFQRGLLRWYRQHGRDLPWRHTQDPYHILVSELMLQQTQVERVLPKYQEWLRNYPTFEALAAAPLGDVKQLWRPLGYNIRPARLHQIAQLVTTQYHGKLPDTYDELIALPGIGRSTAGAILSFAFHQDAPIADTNVQRVLRRLFGLSDAAKGAAVNRQVWQLAEAVIPTGQAYVFNQALMDLGALLCSARKPHCFACFNKKTCLWNTQQHPADSGNLP